MPKGMKSTDNLYVYQIKDGKKKYEFLDDNIDLDEVESTPGSVAQVRACSYELIKLAKRKGFTLFLVGHVTKQGAIAGPRVLEHMVDTVLYFEGDRGHHFRILRAVKNRYGSTNEIGVFEMTDTGLSQIESPSMALLAGRPTNVSGTCVTCLIEGSRPILAEIQGLATTSGFGNPRRMATGFDYNRMAMLIAILEKRAGYFFSNMDCYLNIVGGIKINEPAVLFATRTKPVPCDAPLRSRYSVARIILLLTSPVISSK